MTRTRQYPSLLLSWCIAATLAAFLAFPVAAQTLDDEPVAAPEAIVLDGLQDPEAAPGEVVFKRAGDDFKSPLAAERLERRQKALQQRLAGKAVGKVHEVAKGQYVELALEKTDRIFVVLVEYGTKKWTLPTPTIDGPAHNAIPQPDRATDNSTIWQADYNRDHYVDMYFNKMAQYYRTQSSGRYTVAGDVTEWVRIPFNGSRYGANAMGDAGAWTLIADAINLWTQQQLASGKTIADIQAYLKSFDTWDRYDYDQDGNFNEPDGYIDHFQIVHAGEGEEVGGGTLGADAIWSHRWAAFYNWRNVAGPAYNKAGGLEFGGGWGANPNGTTTGSSGASVGATRANVTNAHPYTPTGVWVLDYTIQPENGGLGVFAHEYGHDLGLPDHYDTNACCNSTGYWTLMSSGSYLGEGGDDIGSRPGDLSAWDKLQLGWLNYELTDGTKHSSIRLGPAETNTKQAQAVVVSLPSDKHVFYAFDPVTGKLPYGVKAWWGGKADLLDTTMTRLVEVPAVSPVLRMRLLYDIESNWDYAYVSASADGGASWVNLSGTYLNPTGGQTVLTTSTNPNGSNLGNGITGSSGTTWRLASFPMTAFAGQNVLLRLRYKTDEFTTGKGIFADEIQLGTFADGAEIGENGWTLNGFITTNGVQPSNLPHYYVAEYRQYRTYDKGLETGPYLFGLAALPDWVTHFPYQDGLLITYWDTDQANNNTTQHRGEGLALIVDAHPEPLIRNVTWPDGSTLLAPWAPSIQSFDSTFGLDATDALTLPYVGTFSGQRLQFWQSHPSLPGVTTFDDLHSYWSPLIPTSSVIVPQTGTRIRIVSTSAQGSFMQVHVSR